MEKFLTSKPVAQGGVGAIVLAPTLGWLVFLKGNKRFWPTKEQMATEYLRRCRKKKPTSALTDDQLAVLT